MSKHFKKPYVFFLRDIYGERKNFLEITKKATHLMRKGTRGDE